MFNLKRSELMQLNKDKDEISKISEDINQINVMYSLNFKSCVYTPYFCVFLHVKCHLIFHKISRFHTYKQKN